LEETFTLGLELRTQLAVSLLERSAYDDEFNPDEALEEIFFRSEASQANGDFVRGWSVAALGGEQTSLSRDFQNLVVQRISEIRTFLPTDSQSLENGDIVDLDGLAGAFPWEPVALQLLQWVRLRHSELNASIEGIGGPAAILANVKKAIASPQAAPEEARPTNVPGDSPRKKRTSFGRHRRRSSRKFDPNAPIDVRAIDALKARERDSGVHFDPTVPQPGEEFEHIAQEEDIAQQTVEEQAEAEATPEDVEAERELSEQIEQTEENTWERTLGGDDLPQGDATLVAGDDEFEDIQRIAPSGPPKSTQDIVAALHSVQPTGKENRKRTFFDRQPNAQRIDFEDGFGSSQPTPGPSNKVLNKGKQRADPPPSVSRKRARPDEESDEEEDAFEAGDRTAYVQDRRPKAPVFKRVRVEPPSSAPAPPSHQPVRASQSVRAPSAPADDVLRVPQSRQRVPASSAPTAPPAQEDSISEAEAPDMTEAEPPRSTYQDQHALALQNSAIGGASRKRQPRRTWTADMEEAFVEYMEKFPRCWAHIEKYDGSDEGYGLLQGFTQVNFKDKARTMAVNMIK
jgi:hypothetical protein